MPRSAGAARRPALRRAPPALSSGSLSGRLAALALAALAAGAGGASAQEACGPYVVQRGDTLRSITQRVYGHDRYLTLFEANRDVLPSPNALEVGQVLRLPCEDGSMPPEAAMQAARQTLDPPGIRPRGPAEEEVRFLTAGGMPPLVATGLPGRGLLPELVRRVMSAAAPGQQFRIDEVRDGDAQLSLLLPMGAFDLGFPWVQPECPARLSAPREVQRLCEDYAFSEPLMTLDLVFYGPADLPRDLEGVRICLPPDYVGPDPIATGLLPRGADLVRDVALADCLRPGPDAATAVFTNRETLAQPPEGLRELSRHSRKAALVAVAPKANPAAIARLEAFSEGVRQVTTEEDWPGIVRATLSDWRREPAR
ncbi:LysM peptidoglycan-binding domain-containing protein [Oceanicella sp. SM1341]|uniref:LysM peptidoglycan-binding domain-containing protein n=1 Tax=Oceanicella sp. SM1341 TaxID=1548889 RepID=UPI0018E51950|nr:LysM peptidoglycan-binding domain-containing protein [Oceanicella sp. SM1341]